LTCWFLEKLVSPNTYLKRYTTLNVLFGCFETKKYDSNIINTFFHIWVTKQQLSWSRLSEILTFLALIHIISNCFLKVVFCSLLLYFHINNSFISISSAAKVTSFATILFNHFPFWINFHKHNIFLFSLLMQTRPIGVGQGFSTFWYSRTPKSGLYPSMYPEIKIVPPLHTPQITHSSQINLFWVVFKNWRTPFELLMYP